MGKLTRFGVSMDKDLIERFDGLIKEEGYINRSEAIRDLIRERLVEEEWEEDDEVCGGILLVYDHHKHHLSEKITEIQHHFYKLVISTQHIHMDHDNCMEIISIRGKARDIKNFFNKLRATTGIKQCDIIKATVGDRIK
jgi:CopG family transcriptional regulator, nickel-responsive regulator